MRKINWEDYPSTATPINADNLNAMQDNIADAIDGGILNAIEEVRAIELYYNASASYVSATLNDNISNYDIITVIGQSSDGNQCSTTIYKPAINDKICLFAPQITSNTTIYNKQAVFQFTSSLVLQSVENHQLSGNTNIEAGNFIKLKAVLGYKL